jgi:hypothetical protein
VAMDRIGITGQCGNGLYWTNRAVGQWAVLGKQGRVTMGCIGLRGPRGSGLYWANRSVSKWAQSGYVDNWSLRPIGLGSGQADRIGGPEINRTLPASVRRQQGPKSQLKIRKDKQDSTTYMVVFTNLV